MTRETFQQLVTGVENGNNQPLQLLVQYRDYCMRMLWKRSSGSCSRAEAEDIFTDAVIDFRTNILKGRVKHQNVQGYIASICWNKWMERSRIRQRRHKKQDEVKSQLYAAEEDTFDPLVKAEEARIEKNTQRLQFEMIAKAMQQLSEKCRRILQLAIVEEMQMKDIAALMGFANANVAKTSKSRCYKKLILHVRQLEGGES